MSLSQPTRTLSATTTASLLTAKRAAAHSPTLAVLAASASLLATKQSGVCDRLGCRRSSHRSCINRYCKTCCIIDKGGCAAPMHHVSKLSERERKKARAPDLAQLSGTSEFEHFLNTEVHLHNEQEKQALEAQHAADAAEIEAELEEQEEHDFQQMAAQSRAMFRPSPSPSSPVIPSSNLILSPPPVASSSLSLLRPPPVAPSRRSISSPPPATPSSMVPSQFQPATSQITVVDSASKRPTITRHMSALWMRDPLDSIHTTLPKKPALRLDPDIIRKFYLVYWDSDILPATIHCVQECPRWPMWSVSDAPLLCKALGIEATALETYNMAASFWFGIGDTYPHKVTTASYVLMRRRAVMCTDLDDLLGRLFKKPTHLRSNMKGERQHIARSLKARQLSPIYVDSDSEVEFVEAFSSPLPKRRKIKQEPSDDTTRVHRRPRLSPLVIPDTAAARHSASASLPSTSASSTSAFSPLFRPSDAQSPSTPASSRSTSPTAPLSPESPLVLSDRKWPHGMYTVDMCKGFKAMDGDLHGNLAGQFSKVFKQTFTSSTYHDARRRWRTATEARREAALAGKRTPSGLWSEFSRQVPLKG
ncbi:hypothetical protein FPV67DRAFT_1674375 [Lyophyllum atratum]|nr:hypothetical protein FPV67DRAFT_1674375 [Lyophyllum atratum]